MSLFQIYENLPPPLCYIVLPATHSSRTTAAATRCWRLDAMNKKLSSTPMLLGQEIGFSWGRKTSLRMSSQIFRSLYLFILCQVLSTRKSIAESLSHHHVVSCSSCYCTRGQPHVLPTLGLRRDAEALPKDPG